MKKSFALFFDDLVQWRRGWTLYIEKKLQIWGVHFERSKDVIVDVLLARRGTYQRPFLHVSLGVLFVVGVMSAPILANTNSANLSRIISPSARAINLDVADYGIDTQESKKPRDQVETYTIKSGDTLSTIAQSYQVTVDTIRWANDLTSDDLTVGDQLKIPPVTGVVHKVKDGDTIYTLAKKYKTDAQKIVNYPFNDFTDLDTFSLQVGQTLVVPDGVIAQSAPVYSPQASQSFGPLSSGGNGQYMWPTNGVITQYPIWYHMALDIANPSAPPVMAAGDGTVSLVSFMRYGYGNFIEVSHGGGYSTLYGHLSEVYVKAGDHVSRGQVMGRMGSTGRSTGTHLHFEVRVNNVTVNPLPYLK